MLCLWILSSAGSAWTAPDGWNTLHPQLYLNLDDAASGTIYGGAMHLETQVTPVPDNCAIAQYPLQIKAVTSQIPFCIVDNVGTCFTKNELSVT